MKSKFILPIALTLIAAGASALHAASTTIDATAAQPTVGTDDVYSYVPPAATDNGGYDYTNNFSNGAGAPGQTFMVTTSGSLTAITLQGLQGAAGNGYQDGTFSLGVYSVGSDGTDLTYLGGGNYTFANQSTAPATETDYSGDYLTFDLSSSISVTAGSEYAFALSSPAGYYGLAGSGSANPYSGGSAIVVGGGGGVPVSSANTMISTGGTRTYDRNFDVQIAAPEPSTWAMLAGGLVFLVAWQRRRLA